MVLYSYSKCYSKQSDFVKVYSIVSDFARMQLVAEQLVFNTPALRNGVCVMHQTGVTCGVVCGVLDWGDMWRGV